ncbi:hypothetical protein FJY63_15400 [Candidatus Sumerlaeota bacterium]|nr:hypothetical protein [Candidatus Sumerlaeota bacterium]
MSHVDLDLAQKTLPELVKDVKRGAHIVITQDKEPVAELVPASKPKPKAMFGSTRGLIQMADDFEAPLADFGEYLK